MQKIVEVFNFTTLTHCQYKTSVKKFHVCGTKLCTVDVATRYIL